MNGIAEIPDCLSPASDPRGPIEAALECRHGCEAGANVVRGSAEVCNRGETWLNPFSTRFVGPGKLRYRFVEDETAGTHSLGSIEQQLLRDRRRRFALIGPHGSGKSTLLRQLTGAETQQNGSQSLEGLTTFDSSRFGRIFWVGTRTCRQRCLKTSVADLAFAKRSSNQSDSPTQNMRTRWFVVDGWAERSFRQRAWLFRQSFRTDTQLIVTSHRPIFGFAGLRHHEFDERVVRTLFEHLVRDETRSMRDALRRELRVRLESGERNVRQLWFELYDEAFRLRGSSTDSLADDPKSTNTALPR